MPDFTLAPGITSDPDWPFQVYKQDGRVWFSGQLLLNAEVCPGGNSPAEVVTLSDDLRIGEKSWGAQVLYADHGGGDVRPGWLWNFDEGDPRIGFSKLQEASWPTNGEQQLQVMFGGQSFLADRP